MPSGLIDKLLIYKDNEKFALLLKLKLLKINSLHIQAQQSASALGLV
jgi:hypothetical protein